MADTLILATCDEINGWPEALVVIAALAFTLGFLWLILRGL